MILIRRPWTRQPQSALSVNWGNPLTVGLANVVAQTSGGVRQLHGSGLVGNGTTPSRVVSSGLSVTNNGESVSSGTVSNFLSLPTTTSAITVLFVGGRFSTPGAAKVSIAACTRASAESAGFEMDLGNAYGDANLLYWYPLGTGTGPSVYVNGKKATGNNPTDVSISNGTTYNIVASLTSHATGTGHTVLAKAAGTSDYAHDVFCLLYATWSRQLAEHEHAALSNNPWQLFTPRSIIIPSAVASSSLPTLTGITLSNITTSGYRATVAGA